MTVTLSSKHRIRFQDCDPLGHLNNSKYLDYFLNAREDQILKTLNLDLHDLSMKRGVNWIVQEHRIAYLRPAALREKIVIKSHIINFNESESWIEMMMYDRSEVEIKSLLWTKFVFVNLTSQRRTNHTPDLMELFQKNLYTSNDLQLDQFEKRVNQLWKK